MKSLDEKKLLVKMSRMLGQPIDPALLESIEREEKLNKVLFKESAPEPVLELVEEVVAPEPVMIVEADPPPPKPAETNLIPPKETQIQQVVNVLNNTAKPPIGNLKDAEIVGIRRQLAEIMQKMSTLSWGGGGTGVVKIWDTDDFVRNSASNGRYMRWDNGYFSLAEVNPHDVTYTTALVTSATYYVTDADYYIGVNYAGPSTIILPLLPTSGRMIIVKDESGQAQTYPVHIVGTIDNDTGGATIAINNGAVQLIYRNGWRII